MDLFDELRIFERIARSGSLSQAARDLNIAPAGVSKRLSDLEQRLGVRLFHRSTRGLALTEEGRAALERTRGILEGAEALEALFRDRGAQVTGTLRLAAPSRFGLLYVVPALADFLQLYPQAGVALALTDRRQDLVADGLDLAVRIGRSPDSSYVVRKLADSARVVCAAPDYLARRGRPRRPEDLAAHDCLVLEDNDVWRFSRGDETCEVRLTPRVRCRDGDAVTELCRRGAGVALKSVWDVHEDLAAGRLVRLLPDYRSESAAPISILLPDRHFVPPRVGAFVDCLKARIGDPPVWQR